MTQAAWNSPAGLLLLIGTLALVACSSLATRLGTLENNALVEVSGLATSAYDSDRYWVMNDNMNAPLIYAVGADGTHKGQFRPGDRANIDWEDLDRFSHQGRSYLVLGDIGDNDALRDFVELYVIPEPAELSSVADTVIEPAWSVRFVYPDGPRDAEALAVSGNDALILSKRTRPVELYRVSLSPLPADAGRRTAVLLGTVDSLPAPSEKEIADAPFTGVYAWQPTAMTIRDDERAALILTTRHAYLYQRSAGESWHSALNSQPQVYPLPEKQDAESVCFTNDGTGFLTTTEALHAAIYRFAVQ